jgi:HEAT repeats
MKQFSWKSKEWIREGHDPRKAYPKHGFSSLLGVDILGLNETKKTCSDSLDGQNQPWPSGDLCEYDMPGFSSLPSTDKLPFIDVACQEGETPLDWTQTASQPDEARVRAIDELGVLRDRKNGSVFVQALRDDYWEVRAAAAQALGALREQTFGLSLLKALSSESDFTVQQSLVRALGKCREVGAIKLLIQILRDQDRSWLVRETAAWSLGEFGQTAPIWPLVEALCNDPDEMVRAAAARALGEIGHPITKSLLAEVMRGDNGKYVREAAEWAFQRFEKGEKWRKLFRAIIDVSNWFWSSLVRQKEKTSGESLVRAYWRMVHKGSLSALTHFIQGKRGFVSHVELVHGDQPTLLLSYCYQQRGQTLRNEVISHIEKVMPVEPIGSVVADHRELLQGVERRVAEMQAKRQWYETTLIIVELYPSGGGPTRAVLCGIGCHAVRSSDPPILDQFPKQWRNYCQKPQEVRHLQIGYQSCGTLSP